jgi:hypothetical protein
VFETTATNGGLPSERMRIKGDGNVGIGTASPQTKMHINGDVGETTRFSHSGASEAYYLRFRQSNPAGGVIAWHFDTRNNNTQYDNTLVLDRGTVSVGTTSGGFDGTNTGIWLRGSIQTFQVSRDSSPAINVARLGTDGAVMTFDKGTSTVGSISVTGSATAYNTSSDYRLKKDVQPMTNALEKISYLKPVTYKWKVDDSNSQGFIAHELQEVFPEAVVGKKDEVDEDGKPRYQGMDSSFLVATLVKAIQELKEELELLKAKVG